MATLSFKRLEQALKQDTYDRIAARDPNISSYDNWSADWEDLKTRIGRMESDDREDAVVLEKDENGVPVTTAKGVYQFVDDAVVTAKNRFTNAANRLDLDTELVDNLPDDPREWPREASDLILAANIFEHGGNPNDDVPVGSDTYLQKLGGPEAPNAKRDIYTNLHHTNVDASTQARMESPVHFGVDPTTQIASAEPELKPERRAGAPGTPDLVGAYPTREKDTPTYNPAGATPNPIKDLYAKVDVAPVAETQSAALPEEEVVPAGYTKVDPTDVRAAGFNPVAALFARTERQEDDDWRQPSRPLPFKAVTPSSYGAEFERSVDAGFAGIRSDTDYFKGIYNTLIGDDEAAEINIQTARDREGRIAEAMSGLESFEEFIDNPTLGGFTSQVFQTTGQLAPYAVTTLGTGGTAAVAGMIGKGALTVASRQVAKKVIRESIERSVKGAGTRSENDLAELAYKLARRNSLGRKANAITPTRAAIVGQLGEEFTLQAGANFGENINIEGLSQQEAAMRALTVAAPQAIVGVAGERIIQDAIFGSLGKIARERGTDGSMLWTLGKEITKATGRGAVGESLAEGTQEALQIANVMQVDPTYTKEDAYMRMGQSFFAGFLGGGAMALGGRSATGSLELTADVFSKAGRFIEQAREQQVGAQFEQEQYGVTNDGLTAPEPKAHINGQIRSLTDPNTSRNSVWMAGNTPEYGASPDSVKQVEIENKTFYTKFIPGRGTIISKDYDVAEAVANDAASDASLQVALGYSSTKPVDADVVVEVREAPTEVGGKGNVIWSEATNEAGLDAAWAAAAKQVPEGGSVGRQSVKAALEERAKLFAAEQGPQVRNMDVEDSDVTTEEVVDMFAEGTEVQEAASTNNVGRQEKYKARDPSVKYAKTDAARQEFAEEFSDLDMEELGKSMADDISFEPDSPFASMPDSLMEQAVRAKRETGNTSIYPQLNSDGTWSLMQTVSPEADVYSFDSRTDTLVDRETEAQLELAERRANTQAQEEGETTVRELLGEVKGIGPKIIERVRKNMTVTQMLEAAASDNAVELFSAIPGVGKKTAERIAAGLQNAPKPAVKSEVKSETQAITSVASFLRGALAKAKKSRYARQKQVKGKWVDKTENELVTVNGQAVNLVDLVKDGQRLFSIEETLDFTEGGNLTAQRNGVTQILSALIAEGFVIKIGGYDIRSKQLKELNDLINSISDEEAAIVKAALDWDVDPDDAQLMGRLVELERTLYESNQPKAKVNSPLDRLKIQRKEWAKEFQGYMNYIDGLPKDADGKPILEADPAFTEPKKPPLLALMDVAAGFEGGKLITLGKLINTTPIDPTPKDAKYQLVNEDGFVVVEGTKQEVQEALEGSGQAYAINKLTWNNVTKEMDSSRLTDEEFSAERNVGFNERNEGGGVDTPVADQSESTMDSMQYSDNTEDGSPDYTFNPEQENIGTFKPVGLPTKTPLQKIAARVVDVARRTLNLKKPVSVISIQELLDSDSIRKLADLEVELSSLGNVLETDPRKVKIQKDIARLKKETKATEARAAAYFGDQKVAQYVIDVAKELIRTPKGGGRYIGFGDAHIILIDPNSGMNALDTAMTVAHELGHALFTEQLSSTLQNSALYNRLFNEFQKARDAKGAPAAYKGKHGFEEWYADQTANWAIGEYTKDRKKGLVGAHFRKIAKALISFHKAFSAEMKKRFGKDAYSPEFDSYMAEVLRRRATGNSKSGAQAATFQEKVIVRKMAEALEKEAPGFVNSVKKQVAKMIRSDNFTPIYNFMFTADSRMRKIAGDKIADLFYTRAQDSKSKTKGTLGFLKAAALEGNAWYNKLDNMIDGDLNSKEVQDSLDEAFSDTPTRDLTGNAKNVRLWLEKFYDEYIEPSNTDIKRQDNYTPIVLKLSAIESDPAGLVDLIMEQDPKADRNKIESAVRKLVAYQQAVMDDKPIHIKEEDPASGVEKAIRLTKGIDPELLREKGYLEDSDVALLRYTNHVIKRVEWNRHTKDNQGNSIYEEELKKLGKRDQQEVKKIVDKYLGYTTSPISPMWRAINSWGSVLQIFAILPLATLGSLPEIAGPVIVSKEFSSVMVGMKEIFNTIKNRDEARLLARDLGVTTSQSVANAMMSQSELEWMDTQARKLTDGFFRVTLLDTYTKFTREFASNMGVRFLMKHSDPETSGAFSTRYLQELGVTAAEVKVWSDGNQDFTTPEGRKVREGLQRFVESGTLRPNAAERPLWASDPHWALFWQLKGFFYSYGKVMLAGSKREATARLEGVSSKDASTYAAMAGAGGVFALMGIATMPLAMLGMELREYAKFGLAWAIPGIDHEAKNYFRTDDLTWPQYYSAAFSRSFAAGPVTIASQAMQAADWGRGVTGAAAVVAGPTAETINRMFTDGFGSTFENRMLPTGLL